MDIFGGTTFLEAPALECNCIEIFLQAHEIQGDLKEVNIVLLL